MVGKNNRPYQYLRSHSIPHINTAHTLCNTMTTMRINHLFSVIATRLDGSRKKNAYALVRAILKKRVELDMANDVAELFQKRQSVYRCLGSTFRNVHATLHEVFELDPVWEYLVQKDAVNVEDDTAFDSSYDSDPDYETEDEDEYDDDSEDEDDARGRNRHLRARRVDISGDDTTEPSDSDNDAYHSKCTYVIHEHKGFTGFNTFLVLMNTVLSTFILTKMLM